MGSKLLNLPGESKTIRHNYGFTHIFDHFVTADRFTLTAGNSGTAVVADGAPPSLTIDASDGSVADNDESAVHQTGETFKFAASKPLFFEAKIMVTEGNTDDSNIWIGLMDAGGLANSMQDDGAGPKASYSGCGFFKVDGDNTIQVENSISTTQKTTQLTAANSLDGIAKVFTSATYFVVRIEVIPHGGGSNDFMFFIDDVLVAKHTDQTYASATDMECNFIAKCGGANQELLNIQWVSCYQKV